MPVACFLYHCDCVLSANFWISFKSFDIEHGQWTCGQIFWGKFFTIFFQRWKMSHIQSIVTGEKAYPMKSKQVFLKENMSYESKRLKPTLKKNSVIWKSLAKVSVEMENQNNSLAKLPKKFLNSTSSSSCGCRIWPTSRLFFSASLNNISTTQRFYFRSSRQYWQMMTILWL